MLTKILLIGLVVIFTIVPVGLTPSQHTSFLPSFILVSLRAMYVSMSISVTYASEMIVCHTIYQSAINEIQKRTVVLLWERVVCDSATFCQEHFMYNFFHEALKLSIFFLLLVVEKDIILVLLSL